MSVSEWILSLTLNLIDLGERFPYSEHPLFRRHLPHTRLEVLQSCAGSDYSLKTLLEYPIDTSFDIRMTLESIEEDSGACRESLS